ncbi:MAG: segregation/condensation protein A [bacterium]
MMDVIIDPQADDYRVDLNVFQGPLDLLLYLIRKEEVDIYDIPIARITKQYIKYIEMMTVLNLEVAGEFILMAATLIRIKARLLLPRGETDADEADPREELIMALIEYKKFKEAGEILRERALLEDRNFVPPSPVGKLDYFVDEIPDVNLFDLICAFKDVMQAKPEEVFHQVDPFEVSVEDRMGFVMAWLSRSEQASFQELFADIPRKIVAVVTFFALLELSRCRRVQISQARPFSELRVYRGERFGEPRGAADLVDFNLPDQPEAVQKETVS